MKKIYVFGSAAIFLLLLILCLPQIASTCTFYPPVKGANPTLVLFQAAGLGMILGGLLMNIWKSWKNEGQNNEEEGGEGDK